MSSDDTTRIIRPKKSFTEDKSTQTLMLKNAPAKGEENHRDDHTMVFRPKSGHGSEKSDSSTSEYHQDPVVGWLVIISGPGKGVSIELGYGVNQIGRDPDQRVTLDFGDEQISRTHHAAIVSDPKSGKFYIQHGDGLNLTYVNDIPVLQPLELNSHEILSIGNTKLAFIPFCGSEFDWSNSV
jgi:hypothetical protein